MNLFSRIWSYLTKGYEDKVQTFTYFIPAPPPRKSGYREKNFDSLIYQLSEKGFQILDIKTQTINDKDQAGVFIIVKIRAITKEAKSLEPSAFPEEFLSTSGQSFSIESAHEKDEKSIELPNTGEDPDEEVKGIYYID